jgi:hypothetical protein
MGKFDLFSEMQQTKRPWKIHPIWRGIGCIMMILIPVLSYAAASVLLESAPGLGLNFPRDMYQAMMLGDFRLPFTMGEVVLTLGFMVAFFGLFTIVFSMVYRVAGPPKYGPTDAPPIKRKVKKSR